MPRFHHLYDLATEMCEAIEMRIINYERLNKC